MDNTTQQPEPHPNPQGISERDVKVAQEYVSTLPQDQQDQFKARFNAMDPAQKGATIQRVILKYGQTQNDQQSGLQGNIEGIKNIAINGPMSVGANVAQSGVPQQAQTAAIAGLPAAVNGVSPQQAYSGTKELLPVAGQSIGAALAGFPGSVGGATIGEAAKQGMDYIDGSKATTSDNALNSAKDIGITAGATAAGEGLFRIPKAMFFAKQMGGAERIAVGKQLGDLADTISNSQIGKTATVSAKNITDKIDNILADNSFERGPLKSGLEKIKDTITNLGRDLNFGEARDLEQQLGREASFAQESSQGHFVTNPKTPGTNFGTKQLRKIVSGGVDDIASQAGHPEYEKLSADFSKLASKFPEKDLQKGMTLGNTLTNFVLTGGAGTYGVTHGSVPAIVASLTGMINAVPQKARTQIFRALIDKAGTKVAENFVRTGVSKGLKETVDPES